MAKYCRVRNEDFKDLLTTDVESIELIEYVDGIETRKSVKRLYVRLPITGEVRSLEPKDLVFRVSSLSHHHLHELKLMKIKYELFDF